MTRKWIRAAVARIVKSLHPQKVILFGSHAYGRPGPDSDVDLLVIAESREPPARRAAEVSRVLADRDYPLDVIVCTPGEIRRRLAGFDPFLEEILKKGRVLYEAR